MTAVGRVKSVKKFENTGSFEVQFDGGKKTCDSPIVKEVTTAVQEESSGGVHPFSARLLSEI